MEVWKRQSIRTYVHYNGELVPIDGWHVNYSEGFGILYVSCYGWHHNDLHRKPTTFFKVKPPVVIEVIKEVEQCPLPTFRKTIHKIIIK